MAKRKGSRKSPVVRRTYDEELKSEAVQMLLDGHSAQSIVNNLGISGATLLYKWKAQRVKQAGPAAETLEARVNQLEEELRRVERERDILKKALAIFSQRT